MIFDERNLIKEYGLPVEKPKLKIHEVSIFESDLKNKLKLILLGQKFIQNDHKPEQEKNEKLWEEVKEAALPVPHNSQENIEIKSKDINKEILRLMKIYRSEKDPVKKEQLRQKITLLKKQKMEPVVQIKEEKPSAPPKVTSEQIKLLEEVNSYSEGVLMMAVIKHDRDLFLEYSQGKIDKDKVLKKGKIIMLVKKGISEEEAKKLLGD